MTSRVLAYGLLVAMAFMTCLATLPAEVRAAIFKQLEVAAFNANDLQYWLYVISVLRRLKPTFRRRNPILESDTCKF
jgi:hypothetical protein